MLNGTAKSKNLSEKRIPARIPFIIITAFVLSAVIITSLFLTAGDTQGKEAKVYKKYYSSMTIDEDETLWNIADKYSGGMESKKEYTDNIRKINNMNNDTIYKGMNLVYYYFVESDEASI